MGSFKVGRHTSNSEEHPVPNYPTWTSGRTRSQVVTPRNDFLILILKGNKMQLSGTAKGMHTINLQFSTEQEFSLQDRPHNLVSHFHVLGTGNSKRCTVIRNHRKGWKRMMSSMHTTDRRKHCPAALPWDWSCMSQLAGGNTNTSSNGELYVRDQINGISQWQWTSVCNGKRLLNFCCQI